MSRKVVFVSTALVLTGSLALFAQQDQPGKADQNSNQTSNQRTGTARDANQADQSRGGQQGQWKSADHGLASCIALGNQEEIALAQLAKQKSHSEEVKSFADMMLKDHQEYLTKLQKFAPDASQPGLLKSGAKGGRGAAGAQSDASASKNATEGKPLSPSGTPAGDRSPTSGTTQNSAKDGRSTDAAADAAGQNASTGRDQSKSQHQFQQEQIERELAQQCLASAEEKLNEKSGAEFDKCFMGIQIAKHMVMKDKLHVFQRHASSELAQVFAAGEKTTEEHLAHAEKLMKTLEHGTAASKSQAKGSRETETKSDK